MPRNGSGTYSLPLSSVVPDTTILASWANTTLDDMALAMTNSIAKNGETNPTAALPMNGFNHTGVAVAIGRTQYARAAEVIDGLLTRCTAVGGTANVITMTAALSTSTYVAGQRYSFTMGAGANTTAVTVNVNGAGAKNLTKRGATALAADDLPANARILMEYDGTQFQLLAPFITVSDVATAAIAAVGISYASNDEIVFRGSVIPSGWTNVGTDNSAIRIMTTPVADGGSVGFSTAFASQAVAGTNTAEASHTHPFTPTGTNGASTSNLLRGDGLGGISVAMPDHTHIFTGTPTNTSAGSSHNHTFTGTAINLAVLRRDMMIIRKT